jgi:hypothetical protein
MKMAGILLTSGIALIIGEGIYNWMIHAPNDSLSVVIPWFVGAILMVVGGLRLIYVVFKHEN